MRCGGLISGKNAAIKFSPLENIKLETMINPIATQMSPGPTVARSPVKITQPIVVNPKNNFFRALKSAMAPTTGALITTNAYETAMVSVHNNVAVPFCAPEPATTATKYALNMVVITTVE